MSMPLTFCLKFSATCRPLLNMSEDNSTSSFKETWRRLPERRRCSSTGARCASNGRGSLLFCGEAIRSAVSTPCPQVRAEDLLQEPTAIGASVTSALLAPRRSPVDVI